VKLQPPRRRLLGRAGGITVYLVDGEQVRNQIDIDFVSGGNGAVYPSYIPQDEVWIDDGQHTLDRTATALHELVERDLMLHHGMSYDRAHDEANVYERAFRWRLMHHRPAAYAARTVEAAYRAYLRGQRRHKAPRQLDREVTEALRGRSRTGSRSR
jgi:hypothetical protein